MLREKYSMERQYEMMSDYRILDEVSMAGLIGGDYWRGKKRRTKRNEKFRHVDTFRETTNKFQAARTANVKTPGGNMPGIF